MTCSPIQWTEGRVVVDGVGLQFCRAGQPDRPALVLAHGLSDNARCWQRVATALGNDFDIVMLDARNHGLSGTAASSPVRLADDIAAVITLLDLDQPAVMGHSVGAHTAALLAGRFPKLVSRLVLEDPPWTAEREHDPMPAAASAQRREDIVAWLGSIGSMTNADLVELGHNQHPTWSEYDYPAWIESNQQVRVRAAEGLDFGSWSAAAAAIACPTLLVRGDAELDGMVTQVVADRVVEQNMYITNAHVPNAGHNIRRENFDDFITVVADFLGAECRTRQDAITQS